MLRSITGWIVLLVFGSVALADPSAARPALAMRLPEVKFESVSLSDCIDFYRDVSDANIHVNWRALESIGIGRDMPVTLDLRAVSLRTALRLTLSQTDPANMTAVYIDEGVIEITTRDIADAQLITRTYFVDDLLMVIPDFYGPDLNLESSQSTGSRSSGGGGGSSRGSIFDDNDQDDEEITTKAERADELISLIQEIVQPNVWRDNGGVATIRYFNGNLIVTAPRSVHEAIGGPIQ